MKRIENCSVKSVTGAKFDLYGRITHGCSAGSGEEALAKIWDLPSNSESWPPSDPAVCLVPHNTRSGSRDLTTWRLTCPPSARPRRLGSSAFLGCIYGLLSENLQIPDLTGAHGHKPDCVNQIWPLTAIRTTPFLTKALFQQKKRRHSSCMEINGQFSRVSLSSKNPNFRPFE